ncbi:MAG: glycosyltransferase family 2 protein [Kiritimatiellia bacterium]
MVKVSVIIPVYNVEQYLRQCLDSVANQTLRDIEIICVDDSSTDGSATVLSEFSSRRGDSLQVVRQPNLGQGVARNRGLELAQGDYVYFMDADDELATPDALCRLAGEMERERLDVLFFDAETRFDTGVVAESNMLRSDSYICRRDYSAVRTGRDLFADMIRHREFRVSPCLMMLRRAFVEKHHLRFPSERIFYEDNIFMTQVMLAAERASHRPWKLYVRKVHAGSTVTSKPTLRHLRGYLSCYRDANALIDRGGWSVRLRAALAERRAVYKLHVRRLADAWPNLVCELKKTGTAEEYAELQRILAYPLREKICNAVRCLRDRGLVFTMRRILFGRQG